MKGRFLPLVMWACAQLWLCILGVSIAGGGYAFAQSRASATLQSVVDGDTIRVQYRGENELVRLIGIDTPESRTNQRAKRQAEESGVREREILELGERASRALSGIVAKGERVDLEFDIIQRDQYGRLLAYVYLGDGRMLNEEMLRLGYAKVYTVPPNVRHLQRFREAFRAARVSQRGLWSGSGSSFF